MTASPLVLPPCLPTELLSYILSEEAHPTTLIICCPRSTFLSALLQEIPPPPPPASETAAADSAANSPHHGSPSDPQAPIQGSSVPSPPHPLLLSTLHQLRISRHITTTFVPTITHLRAYLAIFPVSIAQSRIAGPPASASAREQQYQHQHHHQQQPTWDKPGTQRPKIVVYGLLALHRFTSEWSAQGVGSMLAILVEAGARTRQRVVLVEPEGEVERAEEGVEGGEEDEGEENELNEATEVGKSTAGRMGDGVEGDADSKDERRMVEAVDDETEEAASPEAGLKVHPLWEQRLPLLSGSIRRKLGKAEGASWVGRTVEVGVVLNRWFRFAKMDFWEESGHR